MTDTNPFGDLALRCPPIDVDEAATIARDLFGREGKVRELGSNQDRNYRVDAPDGRFVLKIANPGWERVALEAQNAAMSHLAAGGLAFDVPVPVASPAGNLIEPLTRDGETFDVRLVTYVEGAPLDATPYRSAQALRAVGRIAGETTRALADFEHAGLDRTIQWDLRLARPVVEALDHWVREDARRAQARRLLETAESALDQLRDALPQQAVHADITDYNVMATRDRAGRMMPTGLIDFGDLNSTWRISDVATAVQSLVLGDPTRALEVAIEVTRGFHEVLPLTDDELEAMWPLILARASVCAVCEEQQAIMEPDNAYAQEFLGGGWIVADALEAVVPTVAREAFRAALGLEPSGSARAAAARLAEIGATAHPLVPALPAGTLDLSVRGDVLRFGAWSDPAAARTALTGYEARLESVVSELRSHASAVENALGGHQDSLSTLEARRADIEERLAEAEIRHSVGEYTDDEWSAVGSEAESALEEIGRRISSEQGEITRLSAVLHLVAKPAAPAGAPAPTIRMATPMPEPVAAEPEAPAQPVSGAPRFVPKTPGATPRANPSAPRQAAPVDELAFLKSVTGEHPTRKMPPKKTSESGPMRAVDVAPPPSAMVEADAEPAAPSARSGASTNAKTLKCGECGTLNRPTEWYCERCGAELAAL